MLRDGWFHTGDLARWSADGQLVHCGRVDDLMIVSGVNVYPAEIERVLGEHPSVREAAAFPVSSRIAQELPVCAVTPHAGARVDGDELLMYARDRLGARAPRFVTVLESFPRTSQGRPDRNALREAVLRDMAVRRRLAASAAPGRRAQIAFRCPPLQGVDALSSWFAEWLRMDAPADAASTDPAVVDAASVDTAPADAESADAAPAGAIPAGATPAGAAPGGPPLRDEASRAARRFLWHALALATRLLQAGGVPAFAGAGIEECVPLPNEPGRWRAAVVLPVVDRIAPIAYDLALRAALEACGTMSRLPWGDASRATVDTSLGQAMRRISALVPGGKSTIPLLRAASERGIPFLHLGQGVYQLGWGSRGVRTNRSATARDSAIGARLAQSKSGAAELLRTAGLPVPTHGLASTVEQAMQLAQRIGWPVVLKPDDADRGEGVSVDVDSHERLIAAFRAARASRPNKPVLVERQVPGVCHRLFVARGRLLYAVRRLPKSVIGDGRSTVAALITRANDAERGLPPWSRTEPYPDDVDAHAAIETAGFARDAVPAVGVPVPLRRIESTADGGFDEEVGSQVHPVNVDAALRAASLFDLDVAGIDFISTDIAEPWYRNGAVINEVNFAPLLGGGEISRRHIPEYLARIVEGDGRIPVEIVDDSSADLAEARRRQQAWTQRGMRCAVTSARRTLDAQGREHPMPFTTLEERFRALVLDRGVDAVVLVGSGLAIRH